MCRHAGHRILMVKGISNRQHAGATAMKETIAIIGAADNMGSGIAYRLAAGGYRVLLADDIENDLSPSIDMLTQLLTRIRCKMPLADVNVVFSPREACAEGDIIIPAVPHSAQAELARTIRHEAAGKIIISLTNPLSETHDDPAAPPRLSAAEELARLLPQSTIVKAFNTILASHFVMPRVAGQMLDVFVAGDDDEAVATVVRLVTDAGFNPLVAGKLSMSRTLEHMMALLISLSAQNIFPGPPGWKVLSQATTEME